MSLIIRQKYIESTDALLKLAKTIIKPKRDASNLSLIHEKKIISTVQSSSLFFISVLTTTSAILPTKYIPPRMNRTSLNVVFSHTKILRFIIHFECSTWEIRSLAAKTSSAFKHDIRWYFKIFFYLCSSHWRRSLLSFFVFLLRSSVYFFSK